jgi:hypothetical protein
MSRSLVPASTHRLLTLKRLDRVSKREMPVYLPVFGTVLVRSVGEPRARQWRGAAAGYGVLLLFDLL